MNAAMNIRVPQRTRNSLIIKKLLHSYGGIIIIFIIIIIIIMLASSRYLDISIPPYNFHIHSKIETRKCPQRTATSKTGLSVYTAARDGICQIFQLNFATRIPPVRNKNFSYLGITEGNKIYWRHIIALKSCYFNNFLSLLLRGFTRLQES